MKEKLQFAIATILLSTGIAIAPYNASSTTVTVTSGMRQMVSHQEQQHRITLLPEHGYLSASPFSQRRSSAGQWGTVSKGKSPALLWHRFSLTPQPVFLHWMMAIWRNHPVFVLLAV